MQVILTIAVILIYLMILLIVGIYASRKITNEKSFFLANQSIRWFPLTATLTATVVGGSATIATGAVIYASGLPGLWLDIGGALGLIVLGLTVAKLVRKTGLYTLPQITGKLFDARVRSTAAILVLLTEIAWLALLIQATGAILSVLIPLEYELLLGIITIVFILYTFLGGQFAVIYTDIIQFLVMLIGVCCIAVPILLFDALPQFGQLTSEQLMFPINNSLGIFPVLSFFFMMLMPHIVGPDIYSKLLSAKNESTAKIGALLSGVFKFIFAGAIGLLALTAIVLFPNLENPSLAIPMVILQLSPIIAGIVLAAFLSVMLSSADSVLLSAGTVLSVDITKKNTIFISRIGILLIGGFAFLLSVSLQDIISTLTLAYTVFTAGLTLPILFGFYQKKTKVNSTGALLSLLFGGSISLTWLALGNPFAIEAVLIGLICSCIPLLIFRGQKINPPQGK
jgi:SSS family solute:Na+ symporter